MPDAPPLIAAHGLSKHYSVRKLPWKPASTVKAVDDIDLTVTRGQALGIVGESGSGKSTIARLLMRLIEPTAGTIFYEGRDITGLEGEELRRLRREIQIVFQNPHSALNGRHTIFEAVAEPLVIQDELRGQKLIGRVAELLDIVGLPRVFMYRYPHELSGGQKQRVCIARAVALNPKLLVLDEPTSALDVSVQAQILEFLQELRRSLGLTYVFISHNLAVVRYLCDEVAVMYLGRIVETGPTREVFSAPAHPYTEALIAGVPRLQGAGLALRLIEGDIPSPSRIPSGCRFHTRCPKRIDGLCDRAEVMLQSQSPGRSVACLLRHNAAASMKRPS